MNQDEPLKTRPRRIVILNDDLEPLTQSVVKLARMEGRRLADEGHEVTLIGTVRHRSEVGEERLHGLRLIRIRAGYPIRFRSWFGLYNPQTVGPVRRLLKSLRPDVVHVHNCHTWLSYGVLEAARRHSERVLLTAHDMMLFWGQKLQPYTANTSLDDVCNGRVDYHRSWRERLAAERLRFLPGRNRAVRHLISRNVHTVIAVSHRLREALEQNGITSVATIHNGIEPSAMDVTAEVVDDFRRRWRLGESPVVLFGGRLSGLKGGEALLDAVGSLRHRHQPRILIIGRGSEGYERALDRLIDQRGLADQVIRTGWLAGDQLRAAFAIADIAVNPSLCFETFGLFNIEAGLAAIPVISTFFGGASETVVDGETGLLVNPFRVKQLSEALEQLLDNPELARTMGERGRQFVKNRFSADHAMERLFEFFPKH